MVKKFLLILAINHSIANADLFLNCQIVLTSIGVASLFSPSVIGAYVRELKENGIKANPLNFITQIEEMATFKAGHFLKQREKNPSAVGGVDKLLLLPDRIFNAPINFVTKKIYGKEYDANFYFIGGLDFWLYEKWFNLILTNNKLKARGESRSLRQIPRIAVDIVFWSIALNYYRYMDRCHTLPKLNLPFVGHLGATPHEEGFLDLKSQKLFNNERPQNDFYDFKRKEYFTKENSPLPPQSLTSVTWEDSSGKIEQRLRDDSRSLPCDKAYWIDLIQRDPRYFKIKDRLNNPQKNAKLYDLEHAIFEAFMTKQAFEDYFLRLRNNVVQAKNSEIDPNLFFTKTVADLFLNSPFFSDIRSQAQKNKTGDFKLTPVLLQRIKMRMFFLNLQAEIPYLIKKIKNAENISVKYPEDTQAPAKDPDRIIAESFDNIFKEYRVKTSSGNDRKKKLSFYEHPQIKKIIEQLKGDSSEASEYEAGRALLSFLSTLSSNMDNFLIRKP